MASTQGVKRVGILVGREREFPAALIERINRESDVQAEMAHFAGTALNERMPYDVILDRISHEVPYYRAALTKAVTDGVIVINNPFWWSADNKFVECAIAEGVGVAVPKTVLLPNVAYEADIIDESLRNLAPVDWDAVIAYVGLPAVMKPAIGGGSKNIHMIDTREQMIEAHQQSGVLTMVVQERIQYTNYARCWVIGREEVRVSGYDYHLPRAERYRVEHRLSAGVHDRIVEGCLALSRALGYDMDTMEWAIRDEVPYAIDFLNPAPDCEPASVGQEHFNWVVEHTAGLCIRYAREGMTQPRPEAAALTGALPPLAGS